jgi:glycosyltransferase involved in cell wall biosynthesis
MRTLWENITLPLELGRIKPDIFHSLNYSLPFFLKSDVKKVATVYDLIWVKFPEFFSRDTVLAAKRKFQHTCNVVDKLISISNSTKMDILKYFMCEPEKIEVIYPGVDLLRFKKIMDMEILNKVRTKYRLPSKFVLWVGEPRKNKNLRLLCEAFVDAKLSNKLPHRLVICGNRLTEWQEIKDIAGRFRDCSVLIENVSDDDLPAFYNLADIFLFPSLYEGFGLPPLEAMACGTPVITSNVSSLPEVVGDAAILVNPNDKNKLSSAIVKLLVDNSLRKTFSMRGIERASMFSWEKAAEAVLELYDSLVRI